VLRLLASIIQPLQTGRSIPALTLDVQRDFSAELERCLKALSTTILSENPPEVKDAPSLRRLRERIMLALRLVQFHAGFPSKEPSPTRMAARTGLLARLLAVGRLSQSSHCVWATLTLSGA